MRKEKNKQIIQGPKQASLGAREGTISLPRAGPQRRLGEAVVMDKGWGSPWILRPETHTNPHHPHQKGTTPPGAHLSQMGKFPTFSQCKRESLRLSSTSRMITAEKSNKCIKQKCP